MSYFDEERPRTKTRDQILREKHGFTNPDANEAIERTDKFLIHRVKQLGLGNIKDLGMRRHFERKIAFHEKFAELYPSVKL